MKNHHFEDSKPSAPPRMLSARSGITINSSADCPPATPVNNVRPVVICGIIATGSLVFGYDSGCMSGALAMQDFAMRFGHQLEDGTYELGSDRESLIVSFLAIGTFIGALVQSFFADKIGRKWSVVMWASIFTVGAAIQTSSMTDIWQLLAGRLIAGLGVGALSALVTLFSGEVAPSKLRGLMLTLYSVMNSVGLFLAYLISLGSSHIGNSASWRIPLGMQIPLGLGLVLGMLYIPDSPRRLLYNDKEEKARKALAFINGLPEGAPEIDEMIHDIEIGMAKENEGGSSGWGALFGSQIRSRVIHGMVLMMLQQLSGQNYYYVYGSVIFQESGTGLTPFEIQAVMGAVALLFTFVALWMVDHLGRRRGFLLGGTGQGCCALIAGLVGYYMMAPSGTPAADLTQRNKTGGSVVVAFALIHLAFYNGSSGVLPWVFLGESFPTRLRAKAVSIGTATNWLWYFLVSFFTPRIVDSIGSLILLIFAGAMLFIQNPYVYFLVRETKGLTLEQVDEMYRGHVSPMRSSKWQPSTGPARGGAKRLNKIVDANEPTEVFGDHSVRADKQAKMGAKKPHVDNRSLNSLDTAV